MMLFISVSLKRKLKFQNLSPFPPAAQAVTEGGSEPKQTDSRGHTYNREEHETCW